MKFIKRSDRAQPKVSLILLDWSVRESFHLLNYLSRQDIDRDLFEVIIIEYYSRISDAIRPVEAQVDSWLLLEMPDDCYYHKHLMYNAGIVTAKGEICVICDSDAMVKEGFIRTIIAEFENNPGIVLHIDQFRNTRKDFYPFNYPDFAEVTGKGCINNVGGKTRGVVDDKDTIHNRNYGACMCARRADLIEIGGADEHIDYLGHICGPYDMTFRLVNSGHREIWHQAEFMYHTWHPGQAGEDNYLGPHDGRHVSTTALDALIRERVHPLLENAAIRQLRLSSDAPDSTRFEISPAHFNAWRKDKLRHGQQWIAGNTFRKSRHGFVIDRTPEGFVGYPKVLDHPFFSKAREALELRAASESMLLERLDNEIPGDLRRLLPVIGTLTYLSRAFGLAFLYLQRRLLRFSQGVA